MNRRSFLRWNASALGALAGLRAQGRPQPNIVLILADDAGYGDLSCYGATRVHTPNLDRLATEGVRFTDAHSSAATCTPSRYSLMTGEYAWRKKDTNILPGDAPLIIEPGRTTLPSMLHDAGYQTGCVGKWHLGLGKGNVDWNVEIRPGPLEIGFDYSFILPATGDRVPCVYVENHRVVGLNPKDPLAVSYLQKVGSEPTGKEHPEYLRMPLSHGHDQTIVNGISRIGYLSGGKSAWWVDEDMAGVLTGRAAGFIEQNRSRPFFLYFATHDIHVPRVPRAEFRGSTQCGVRCDAVAELDWSVGVVMNTLKRLGLKDNTLLMFTSDNGPVVDDGYADGSVEALNGHVPAGGLRGGKYQIYEGGTRMPFIACWPGRIRPGVSDALFCQVDLLASFASLARRPMTGDAAPDSFNMLPVLLGQSKSGRQHLVEQANQLALREGKWKFVESGELYNLAVDPAEAKDVASEYPDRMRQMRTTLDQTRSAGRTRQ
jgi:arylsulfatase A-like enzyme